MICVYKHIIFHSKAGFRIQNKPLTKRYTNFESLRAYHEEILQPQGLQDFFFAFGDWFPLCFPL